MKYVSSSIDKHGTNKKDARITPGVLNQTTTYFAVVLVRAFGTWVRVRISVRLPDSLLSCLGGFLRSIRLLFHFNLGDLGADRVFVDYNLAATAAHYCTQAKQEQKATQLFHRIFLQHKFHQTVIDSAGIKTHRQANDHCERKRDEMFLHRRYTKSISQIRQPGQH